MREPIIPKHHDRRFSMANGVIRVLVENGVPLSNPKVITPQTNEKNVYDEHRERVKREGVKRGRKRGNQ